MLPLISPVVCNNPKCDSTIWSCALFFYIKDDTSLYFSIESCDSGGWRWFRCLYWFWKFTHATCHGQFSRPFGQLFAVSLFSRQRKDLPSITQVWRTAGVTFFYEDYQLSYECDHRNSVLFCLRLEFSLHFRHGNVQNRLFQRHPLLLSVKSIFSYKALSRYKAYALACISLFVLRYLFWVF